MSPKGMLVAAVLAITSLAAGCVHVAGDAGFHDVSEAVRQRSGLQPRWNRQSGDGTAVAERIRSLLSQELTVEGAVEVALLDNRRLQAAFEELGIARADLLLAGRPRNPVLGGEVRFPADPFKPFEVLLTQSLLELFQLPARRRIAAAGFEQAKLKIADEVLRLVAEVRSSYYTLQSTQQISALRRAIVESARSSAELAIRQREVGNITDLDLETAQAAYEQGKVDLARSETEVLIERERLSSLMGVWGPATQWSVAASLPDLPAEETGLEDLESVAIAQRLDLAVARQEAEIAARSLGTARADAIGDIVVGVHRERDAEGGTTTGPSIEVPLPIFGRGGPAKSRAQARVAQSQELYAALAVEIRSSVRVAHSQLLASRERALYYKNVILPRRRRIVEQSQLEYNAMLRGIFQVLLAKESEIDAQRESIEAQRDYWVARVELEHSTGGKLDEGNP